LLANAMFHKVKIYSYFQRIQYGADSRKKFQYFIEQLIANTCCLFFNAIYIQ